MAGTGKMQWIVEAGRTQEKKGLFRPFDRRFSPLNGINDAIGGIPCESGMMPLLWMAQLAVISRYNSSSSSAVTERWREGRGKERGENEMKMDTHIRAYNVYKYIHTYIKIVMEIGTERGREGGREEGRERERERERERYQRPPM